MEIKQVFATNLRHYRQANGISQEELAHQAGVDRTYISSLERCCYAASIEMIGKLAEALKVEPWRLLADVPEQAKDDVETKNGGCHSEKI